MLTATRTFLKTAFCYCFIYFSIVSVQAEETCESSSASLQSKQLTNTHLTEDDLQIVVLKVGTVPVAPDLEIYANENQLLVPVNALIDVLSVNLHFFPAQNKLSGKLLASDCPFELGLSEQTSTSNSEAWFWYQDDFDTYVDVRAIAWIINAEYEFDQTRLLLIFRTKEYIHGLELLTEEEIQHTAKQVVELPDLILHDEYAKFTYPVVGYRASSRYQSHTNEFRNNVQLNGYLDFLEHSAELRINHSNTDTRAFFKLSKKLDSRTLGWGEEIENSTLSYELGDIQRQSTSLIHSASLGLGARFFNRDSGLDRVFSTTTIEETALPGWRAELYRNGQFVDQVDAGPDNRVVFTDVETFYGQNRFEIRMYGNQGEQETRVQLLEVGNQLTREGELGFEVSYVDPELSLLSGKLPSAGIGRDARAILYYGLSDVLTVNSGVHYVKEVTPSILAESLSSTTPKTEHYYASAGLTYQMSESIFNVQAVQESDGGNAALFGYSARFLNNIRMNANAKFFDDFYSARFTDRELASQAELRLSGRITALDGIAWSGGASYQNTTDNDEQILYRASLSKSFQNLTLATNASYLDHAGEQTLTQRLFATLYLGRWQLNQSVTWQPNTDRDFDAWRTELRWPQQRTFFNQTRLTLTPDQTTEVELSHTLTWRRPTFNLQFGMNVDDRGEWEASATITGTFNWNPSAEEVQFHPPNVYVAGVARPFVYFDENRNNQFDENDEPLEHIRFLGNSSWKDLETGEDGRVYLPVVSNGQRLKVDEISVPDAFRKPKYNNILVFTHRGGVKQFDIPIQAVNDIEGVVFFKDKKSLRAQARVPLKLINAEGEIVSEVFSESDGFYLFQQVPPGEYQLTISDEYLEKHSLVWESMQTAVVAPADGDIVQLDDILLLPMVSEAPHNAIQVTANNNVSNTKQAHSKESTSINTSAEPPHILPEATASTAAVGSAQMRVWSLGEFNHVAQAANSVADPAFESGHLVLFRNSAKHVYELIYQGTQLPEHSLSSQARALSQLPAGERIHAMYELKGLSGKLSQSLHTFAEAPANSYFCQMASFSSPLSLATQPASLADLLVFKRTVNQKVYYTLFAGPFDDVSNQCIHPNVLLHTPEQPIKISKSRMIQLGVNTH